MIPQLTAEDRTFITAQLLEKGFAADSRVIDSGFNLFADLDRFEWDMIAFRTYSFESKFSHFLIFSDALDDSWRLYEVRSQHHWNTQFTPSGVDFMTRQYNADNGPIPNREQIEADILQEVAQRQVSESILLDDRLRIEFGALGYLNYNAFLKTVQRQGNLAYLATSRDLPPPAGSPGDRVDFRFIVSLHNGDDGPRISMMKATFIPAGEDNKDRRYELTYSQVDHIPPMSLIMKHIKTHLAERRSEFDRLVNAFGFITDITGGQMSYSQLRAGGP